MGLDVDNVYNQIYNLKSEWFRRLTRVKLTMFTQILLILAEVDAKKKSKGGRSNKLCFADQLLLTLDYMREYKTYSYISQNYGIIESS